MNGSNNRRGKLHAVPQPTFDSNQVPPHDEERELALLGAILTNGQVANLIVDLVKPADFYDGARGLIFDAMMQLRQTGENISRVSVMSWLKDRGTLTHAGGPMAIGRLANEYPVLGDAVEHAKRIALKAKRRAFILECQATAAEGMGDVGDESDWLDQRSKSLRRHAANMVPSNAVSLRKSIDEFFVQLNADTTRRGAVSGYSTGLHELNELTAGWHGGDVTLIGGPTGFGKSAFMGCQAVGVSSSPQIEVVEVNGNNVDCNVPIGVAIFSLEMRRKKLAQRLCCGMARVNYKLLQTGNAHPHDFQKLIGASDHLSNLPIVIDDAPDLTMDMLEAKLARIQAMFAAFGTRLGLVLIDYMQLMDVSGEGQGEKSNREIQFNLAGRRLQKFASTFLARPKALPVVNGVVVDAGYLDPSLVAFGVLVQLNDDGQVRESKALQMHAHGFWLLEPTDEEPQGPGKTTRAKIRIKKQREGDSNVVATCWRHAAYTLYSDEER
jgi:replicative DNA helicase